MRWFLAESDYSQGEKDLLLQLFLPSQIALSPAEEQS
jgi:hypothetical protein